MGSGRTATWRRNPQAKHTLKHHQQSRKTKRFGNLERHQLFVRFSDSKMCYSCGSPKLHGQWKHCHAKHGTHSPNTNLKLECSVTKNVTNEFCVSGNRERATLPDRRCRMGSGSTATTHIYDPASDNQRTAPEERPPIKTAVSEAAPHQCDGADSRQSLKELSWHTARL